MGVKERLTTVNGRMTAFLGADTINKERIKSLNLLDIIVELCISSCSHGR